MAKGFYITRTNGKWETVTPIRRRYAIDLNDAIELLMEQKNPHHCGKF